MSGLVVVTGASRGLGRAIAIDLWTAGYEVVTGSRTCPEDWVDYSDGWVPLTLGDHGSERHFADIVRTEFGVPYALINNAGIAVDGILATQPPADIDTVIATNLAGTLRLTRHLIRPMLAAREGRIINISSIVGSHGFSGLAAYSATKAGLDGFTRALAREVGPRNITVNAVAPGFLDTDMAASLSAKQQNQIVRRTPLGRLGTPADVVGIVRFLLSEHAGFVTGQTFTVDGGAST